MAKTTLLCPMCGSEVAPGEPCTGCSLLSTFVIERVDGRTLLLDEEVKFRAIAADGRDLGLQARVWDGRAEFGPATRSSDPLKLYAYSAILQRAAEVLDGTRP